jgi:hypothetical protein
VLSIETCCESAVVRMKLNIQAISMIGEMDISSIKDLQHNYFMLKAGRVSNVSTHVCIVSIKTPDLFSERGCTADRQHMYRK